MGTCRGWAVAALVAVGCARAPEEAEPQPAGADPPADTGAAAGQPWDRPEPEVEPEPPRPEPPPAVAAIAGVSVAARAVAEDGRQDQDRDGHTDAGFGGRDCDDGDATVHPDAVDIWYDGIDQDCDGADDFDADGDGHRSGGHGGGDCHDAEPAVHPGATEVCGSGTDEDCDGLLDCEDADCATSSACMERDCRDGLDNDGDGTADCDDMDCVGRPGCPAATLAIHGGQVQIERALATSHISTHTWVLRIRSMSGSVRVRTSAHGGTDTCTFTGLGAGLWAFSSFVRNRSSVQSGHISGGCGLDAPSLVPFRFFPSLDAASLPAGFQATSPWFATNTSTSRGAPANVDWANPAFPNAVLTSARAFTESERWSSAPGSPYVPVRWGRQRSFTLGGTSHALFGAP